ncbi:ABC transporter permease [Ponticoccus sp. SC2-23]|uniref:ABC transporter permease n=1 Tax=Alexandriicola marinus TaxID=2081710 RepID=UPI000FDBD495|nr:ABC transporter permease [Alexandriicola marinus]MBM1220157.1 ABC transporter permease [Ponticoccus sp. SC6-9]MBM1224843.1 ABC transporter permease [Ponticoccus sp. SC6-15]MBM1228357.1 ABC transporter permease [Ponticoccus sp. SC6-38]MBM1234006.1 ABC transporter permease [Ponticoccus sp. SC6-45]MBM1238858.1 ABC transporter permease [Ponticoccus sp. SC6-49]MBM1242640.1 ABC transporter permease [Ponticoccus sp. SC2-64]MBM1247530.1 ABC transporter permease [Ponticoccus sp. SC6-42]MBM1251811
MEFLTIIQIGDSTIRLAIPLLLACLAGLFSERAGIFDIGLEGKMLAAAFLAAAISFVSGSAWIGLLAGITISILLSIIHGLASITFRGNQLISGVAINFLAAGLTVVVAQSWFSQGSRTPQLSGSARFEPIVLPGALSRMREIMEASPMAQLYSELISGHTIIVYIGFLAVPLSWWILYRTRFGLRLRAVGENPAAVDTAGISVVRLRFAAVAIAGILCGIAGAYLSTALQAGFTKDMTANRGFIALAALIFAKWRPWYAMGTCLLFGFFFAIDNRFQNIQMPALWFVIICVALAAGMLFYAIRRTRLDMVVLGGFAVVLLAVAVAVVFGTESLSAGIKLPTQLTQSLPYILTVVVLAGFVGKAIPPRAGGEAYVKER